jgi:hypothetical protein
MINVTKKPSDAHKKTLKEEILGEIHGKDTRYGKPECTKSNNSKTPKIKNMRRHKSK